MMATRKRLATWVAVLLAVVLVAGAVVRVSGIEVGTIESIQPEGTQTKLVLKVDRNVIETVQEGMREVIQSGTGIDLKGLPVDICGKTGSAEFANETNAHAWFTAYAPCDNPKIVLTVMIEGGGEGSDVAVPAAKRIFESYFGVQASEVPVPREGESD